MKLSAILALLVACAPAPEASPGQGFVPGALPPKADAKPASMPVEAEDAPPIAEEQSPLMPLPIDPPVQTPRLPQAPSADVAYGAHGEDVARLQLQLKLSSGGRLDEDGRFGPATRTALQTFAGAVVQSTSPALRESLNAQASAKALSMSQVPTPPGTLAENLAAVQVLPSEGGLTKYYAAGDRTGFGYGDGPESTGITQGSVQHIDWVAGDVLSPSEVRVIGTISRNEGPFDAVNSYDSGYYTWGAYQLIGAYRTHPYYAGDDELSQGMAGMKQLDPQAFADRFGAYGFDVLYTLDSNGKLIKSSVKISLAREDGTVLRGIDVWIAVGTEPRLNQIFINAGRDLRIQRVHVLSAKAIHFDALTLPMASGGALPIDLFTSERLVAGFLDMELNQGRSKARSVFTQAVAETCAAQGLDPSKPSTWPDATRTSVEQAIFAKALQLAPSDRYRTRLQRVGDSALLSADAGSYK